MIPLKERTLKRDFIINDRNKKDLNDETTDLQLNQKMEMKNRIIEDLEEPPLLEELGINFRNIYSETLSVLIPKREIDSQVLTDGDLIGPILFSILLGFCLLMKGKLHFGYIFGYGIIGSVCLKLLLSLISNSSVPLIRTTSILGYSILPIVFLAFLNIFFQLRNIIGIMICLFFVLWSTVTATQFLQNSCVFQDQTYIIAYPVFLIYSCFVVMTVF